MDYYVYGHYTKSDNKLFYIGKGRYNRKDSIYSRNKDWLEFVKDKEWYSVILFSGLSNSGALKKEREIINSVKNTGILNKVNGHDIHEITKDLFSQYFYYDETSETCLRWNTWNGQKNHSKRVAGDVAGFPAKDGFRVGLFGKEFKVHRIVYCLNAGEILPDLVIDHIDGNPRNNKICNLRLITQAENCKNMSIRSDNNTGAACVRFRVEGKATYVMAYYRTDDRKRVTKFFSISKYGLMEAFAMACEWRKYSLMNKCAGYTERHGT